MENIKHQLTSAQRTPNTPPSMAPEDLSESLSRPGRDPSAQHISAHRIPRRRWTNSSRVESRAAHS